MTDPSWHDADPRPPFGGVPGPQTRSARGTPAPSAPSARWARRGSDQPAAWEEPGWYREDPSRPAPRPSDPDWDENADPFSSVPMTGSRRPEDRMPASRRVDRRGEDRPGDDRFSEDERGVDGPGAAGASSWRWGELSGGRGTLVVVAAAVLGAIATVVAKTDPGLLLGAFILVGALIAGFAVRQRAAYLLIPVPVLTYLVFALAAGLLRSQNSSSKASLTVSAAQWVANGFLIMIAAVVVVSMITVGRWFLAYRADAAPAGRRRQGGRPGPEVRPEREGRPGREGPPGGLGRPGPEGRPRPEGRSRPEARPRPDDRPRSDDRPRPGAQPRPESRPEARPRPEDRPRPTFHPNPDYVEWPGDRRPPPGPPSFGSSRDLTATPRRVSGG